jgi:GNAT superfamily N-acetyltransferase
MLVGMTQTKSKAPRRRKASQAMTFRVDFEVSLSQHEGDPSDFIMVYEGAIIGTMDNDSELKIGTLTVYMVERGRVLNEGMSLFDVMDCLDGDSCDCFANLFDHETEQLKPKVEQLLSEDRACLIDMMLIEKLELESKYRGQGIGKTIALRAIQKLGANCGVITCVPVPLQFTGLGPNDERPKGMRLAQQQVRAFWEGVGFVRIPRSDYYIWPD